MGYYTKHLFRIVGKKQPTVNDYKELAKVIIRVSEGEICALKIHDGVMDDSNYNTADGAKWYSFKEQIRKIALEIPEVEFTVDWMGETYHHGEPDKFKRWHFKNGELIEETVPDESEFNHTYYFGSGQPIFYDGMDEQL